MTGPLHLIRFRPDLEALTRAGVAVVGDRCAREVQRALAGVAHHLHHIRVGGVRGIVEVRGEESDGRLFGVGITAHDDGAFVTQPPVFAPPPLLKQMVHAGYLGRKSGRGFYSYG